MQQVIKDEKETFAVYKIIATAFFHNYVILNYLNRSNSRSLALTEEPTILPDWKFKLAQHGFVYLPNQSEPELHRLLPDLGRVLYETDVIANRESKSLVTSHRFLDFHTDNHLAKYIVWFCCQPATEGGITLLCDAQKVYNQLSEEEKIQISKIHVFEHKLFPENRNSNPIVRKTKESFKFYYSFWLAREKYRKQAVFQKWQKLIKEAAHTRIKMNMSDILIVDNHRILHGRTEIMGHRFLKRYWIKEQMEKIESL